MINGINLPQGNNRGRLFPFKDTGPHYLGPAVVDGLVYRVAAWKNLTADGKEYLRLTFEHSTDYDERVVDEA